MQVSLTEELTDMVQLLFQAVTAEQTRKDKAELEGRS